MRLDGLIIAICYSITLNTEAALESSCPPVLTLPVPLVHFLILTVHLQTPAGSSTDPCRARLSCMQAPSSLATCLNSDYKATWLTATYNQWYNLALQQVGGASSSRCMWEGGEEWRAVGAVGVVGGCEGMGWLG